MPPVTRPGDDDWAVRGVPPTIHPNRPSPPAGTTPDLDTLRLRALAVTGVARLADHHDGGDPHPGRTPSGALRVFDGHVEVDLVLSLGHAVPATAAALRAALAPLVGGRTVHVTVLDVDPER